MDKFGENIKNLTLKYQTCKKKLNPIINRLTSLTMK